MQVILLQDLYNNGVAGEVVDVAPGFARNFLIPRKIAIKATSSALKETENIRKNVEARKAQYNNMLNDLARQIDGVELIFGRRAASTGKLFGSVTTQEIAEELDAKTGVDLNRRRISQQGLREVGTHEVSVSLGSEISPTLTITIVPEEQLADFLAARERGEEITPEDIMADDFEFDQQVEEEDEEGEDTPIEAEADAEVVEDASDMETEVLPQEVVQEALAMDEEANAEDDTDE